MKIAIVDSGIDRSHRKLSNAAISGVHIYKEHGEIVHDDDYEDSLGHGTATAAIIHGHAPSCELLAVKVFDRDLVCEEVHLREAVAWCIDAGAKIINMSLGVMASTPSQELYDICRNAVGQGIVIVAAAANVPNQICYPAYFAEVLGVAGHSAGSKRDYGFRPSSPIEFLAKGSIQRVAGINGGYKIVEGTSYACAHFTGIVANKLLDKPALDHVTLRQELASGANPKIEGLYVAKNNAAPYVLPQEAAGVVEPYLNRRNALRWVGRMALFPVSEKEMKLFGDFPELSAFRITMRLDYPRNVKRDDTAGNDIDNVYYNFPSDEDFDRFDTLVLGYFHEHLFQVNVKYGFELISKAIEKGKNFFVFDAELKTTIDKMIGDAGTGNICYAPVVDDSTYETFNSFRYRPNISTPVLCVTGTTNKLGKFTTQLRVKSLLEREGYKVSFVSSEPHAELFGASFSFPFGHNDTVFMDYRAWPDFLRTLTKAIEYVDQPDIILTGTQSWTIPPSFTMHPSGGELDAMQFMFGMQPDAVICAINPNDSIELIKRTLGVVNVVSAAKPLFFVITPWEREMLNDVSGNSVMSTRKLTAVELEERIDYYRRELNAPVINVMDAANDCLIVDAIMEYYS